MNARYLALDALRGIFATMIVFYHMQEYSIVVNNFFINKSLVFVDYFFVLSGFVIYHNYQDRIFNQNFKVIGSQIQFFIATFHSQRIT